MELLASDYQKNYQNPEEIPQWKGNKTTEKGKKLRNKWIDSHRIIMFYYFRISDCKLNTEKNKCSKNKRRWMHNYPYCLASFVLFTNFLHFPFMLLNKTIPDMKFSPPPLCYLVNYFVILCGSINYDLPQRNTKATKVHKEHFRYHRKVESN